LLRSMGAEHVVSSSDAGFESSLHDLCQRLGATIGFDAVAGEMSGTILRAQPLGSQLLVYGGLSFAPCQVDPSSLIFEGKRPEGFWLSKWLRSKSLLGQVRVSRQETAWPRFEDRVPGAHTIRGCCARFAAVRRQYDRGESLVAGLDRA